MKILVAEDNDTLRATIRATLETEGHIVQEGEDGMEAMRTLCKMMILMQSLLTFRCREQTASTYFNVFGP